MDLAPTTPEIQAARDPNRIPDTHALARLLQDFFVGPIEPAVVTRLESELRALLADRERDSVTADAFMANSHRYVGQVWKELVSNHRFPPSPTELAIWLAVTTKGYPAPRPHCPAPLVGTWRQVRPAAATWRFDADGTVQTDDAHYKNRNRWRVHVVPNKASYDNDELMLTGDLLFVPTTLAIREVTPTVLRAFRSGPDGPIEYVLERA